MRNIHVTSRRQMGFMLLEAMISILIFSMGVIALMGLQAVSMQNNIQSKYRTDASFLANQIVGQMWTDKTNFPQYGDPTPPGAVVVWKSQVANTLPNGLGSITIGNGNIATVIVAWQAPGSSQHRFVEIAQINY